MKQQLESKDSLQAVINILKERLENLPEINTNFSLEEYQTAINSINNDIFEIPSYEKMLYDESKINEQELNNFCNTLKILKNNKFIQITDNQKEDIKKSDIYKNIIALINDNIKKMTQGQDIKELIDEMIKNNTLEDSTIDKLYEILKKYNISKKETIIIFKNLMMYINNIQNKETDAKQKLTEEQLIELFSRYGYDFNKVLKEFQSKLLLDGNLSNIEEMFQNMPHYRIEFNEKNKAHLYLILKSSKKALEKMKNLSEKYGFDYLEILEKSPAPFMHKSSINDVKQARPNDPEEDKKNITSAFEDFCENIEIISKLGYNIPLVIKKAFSVFTKSSTIIKRNVELLRQYDFFEGDNLAITGCALSALKSSNLQEIIDIFIELGELQYIKDNASRLILDKNSQIIKRIYFAKKNQKELPNIKKIKAGKEMLTGIITTEENKEVDKYIDLKSIKHTVFDEELDKEIGELLKSVIKELDNQTNIDDIEEINFLDNNYKKDKYVYDFNGTIISNRKVKKLYPLLLNKYPKLDRRKLLLYAITYNSMMSNEEFENISNIIIAKEKKI